MATTADRFRTAVAAGEWARADGLLTAYRLEVEVEWRSSASAEERQRLSTEVTELLQWARSVAMTGRARTQGKIVQIASRTAYNGVPPVSESVALDA